MGPIEKKVEDFLKSSSLSQETINAIKELKLELKNLEVQTINQAYSTGFNDKEKGKSYNYNYFSAKYSTFFNRQKL